MQIPLLVQLLALEVLLQGQGVGCARPRLLQASPCLQQHDLEWAVAPMPPLTLCKGGALTFTWTG